MSKARFGIQPFLRHAGTAFMVAAMIFSLAFRAHAQTEQVLFSLPGGANGSQPQGPLAEDKSGNFYATTFQGGAHGFGAVIELSLVSGVWQETVLHSFTGGRDGANPYASVVLGPNGDLFGTTGFGGDLTVCGGGGCGVVFELSPVAGGWKETVLHVFRGGLDGSVPQGLAFDPQGNLYGLAEQGGTAGACNQNRGCGTVFQLTPQAGGLWQFSVIHIFDGGYGGATPALHQSPLVDANGNLYATTFAGGNPKYCQNTFPGVVGCGVVFKLSNAFGGWRETVLYRFFGFADGAFPGGRLVMDSSGNLYGSASAGGNTQGNCKGNYGCGVVFELSPASSGLWNATTLHTFAWTDGLGPGGLAFDQSGNLYGSTGAAGDPVCNCGTVFKLTAGSGGGWTSFNTLHAFQGGSDGRFPTGIMLDSSGNVFGSTSFGGTTSNGTFYEITP